MTTLARVVIDFIELYKKRQSQQRGKGKAR